MVLEMKNPIPPKYYIAWSGLMPDVTISYGYIESDQWLTTGLDNLESFIEKQDYINRLLDFGIDLLALELEDI